LTPFQPYDILGYLQAGAKKSGGEKAEAKRSAESSQARPRVWRKGVDELDEGETLEYDKTTYYCLHYLALEWPCLSFDLIRDPWETPRHAFPHKMLMVAGTQAAPRQQNYIAVMKLDNMGQAGHGPKEDKKKKKKDKDENMNDDDDGDLSDNDSDDDDLSDSDSEEEDDEDPPLLHCKKIAHSGGVNRIRVCPQAQHIVATWSDAGQVNIFDVKHDLEDVTKREKVSNSRTIQKQKAEQVFGGHNVEGFALDWSPLSQGRLLTGDCKGKLFLWEPNTGGKWDVGKRKFTGHNSSIEDIQWSSTEPEVFMTSSVDKTIRVWDCRASNAPMLTVENAHEKDVNVISWNKLTSHILASGGDDHALKIWDLRNFSTGSHVANYKYHVSPITAVEWCPYESSMLLTCGEDDQLCIWDVALERDPEEEAALKAALGDQADLPEDIPPQLLFVHQGMTMLKEGHWHTQIPGMMVSTAVDGFNVFKPFNV